MTVDKRYCECEDPTGFAEYKHKTNSLGMLVKECRECGQEWVV